MWLALILVRYLVVGTLEVREVLLSGMTHLIRRIRIRTRTITMIRIIVR